jgi:PAS domain S-box-containing protein
MKALKARNGSLKKSAIPVKELPGQKTLIPPMLQAEDAQAPKHDLEAESFPLEVGNQEIHRTLIELKASSRSYSELFELAPVAYFVLSPVRQITNLNQVGAQLLQWPKESLLGKQLDLYVAHGDIKEFQSFCLHALDALSAQSGEFRLRTPLGRVVDVEMMGLVVSQNESDEQLFVAVREITRAKQTEAALRQAYYDLLKQAKTRAAELAELNEQLQEEVLERRLMEKTLREREAELSQKHCELKELTAQLITAQDMERRRLSLELHDDFGQQLASLSVDVQQMQKNLRASGTDLINSELQALQRRVLQIARQVHQLAYQLHPSVLEHLGLVVAVRSYISEWEAQEKIKATFTDRNLPASIPDSIAACLYRVVQEGLRNVARHSRSQQVAIALRNDKETLSLSIKDWGVGFSKDQENGHRGLGILGMQERVHLVKGKFFIKSRRRHGTEIVVQVPLARRSP